MALARSEETKTETAAGSYARLRRCINDFGKAVLAFSGGVDSSLVLAAASDALGASSLAVTACSETYPAHEREQAAEIARFLGARHRFIESHEMEDRNYRANPPDRCYYCKRELYRALAEIADREGNAVLVDGTNLDDLSDIRPGRIAAMEFHVRSPLAELGFGKSSVREMARYRGLPNWEQPACACLASRIPFGEEITPARVQRVAGAEMRIREIGLRMVRVRDYGDTARIEVGKDEIGRTLLFETRRRIVEACKSQGYTFVCLDLEGYRTGSMNEGLKTETPLRGDAKEIILTDKGVS